MQRVVFVAPFFGSTILGCLEALLSLEGVQVGVITQQDVEHLPRGLRARLAGHYQVKNTLDPAPLVVAGRAFQKEWGGIDRLIGYLEQLQLPLAQAREVLGIPGMRPRAALRFRDKNLMKQALAEAGLPVARQARVHSLKEARAFVEAVGYPLIVKPLDGLGSKDTFRVTGEDDLLQALNKLLPSRERPLQAEEFISGAEHTFETACVEGVPQWGSSSYYLPGPLKVIENPWMQYCVLLPRENSAAAKAFWPLNVKALEVLGLGTGLAHMEWFQTPSGRPVISEVAARPPGVNIMMMNGVVCGVDFWERWARLMALGSFTMPARQRACGCAFLRGAGRGGSVARITGLEETLAQLGESLVKAKLPQVGQPRSSHYEGEGWVLVTHPETQGVVELLRKVITQIRIDYA